MYVLSVCQRATYRTFRTLSYTQKVEKVTAHIVDMGICNLHA
jgi:hypothetical protein